MHPFNNPNGTDILDRIHKCIPPERCISVRFIAEVPPVRTLALDDQWRRFKSVVHCHPVVDALGTMHGAPIAAPDIYYATKFATVGVLANFLDDWGVWGAFLEQDEDALSVANEIVSHVAYCGCDGLECYYLDTPWSDWFIGDNLCDRTFLLGRYSAWWLLAITATD